ncbi:MAG: hypothetical protein H6765_00415 [Candidatus Peribacteria bacterium]|nr:MAG: hypothetical protein H6765_00415 [Candidatus Peribacteria bacterium]
MLVTGVIGYAGIWLLFKAMSKLDVAIVMMIASSYVFFSYFLNIALFPDVETLSWAKIGLALIFFVIVCLQLLQKNTTTQRFEINTWMLVPVGTALCWSVFFGLINYFVKDGYLSPFQSVFYTE